MKVLHLICTDVFSGAENVACQIINGFKAKKDYEMVYCSPSGTNEKSLTERKIKHLKLDKFNYKSIKKAVREYKPDIIHAHDIKSSVMAALTCNRKIKIISHIHSNHENMRKINIKTILFNLVSKKFSKIIWVSQSAFDSYVFKSNIINKSTILYNVIDSKEICDKIEKDSKKYVQYDLIYLGRLTYAKNPERLLEIINDIKKRKTDIKVAIVGTGDLENSVKEIIEKYKLSANVDLLGYMTNPYKVLNSSKILILTSRYEGTPMVALEAIAIGKPIISTPTDGMVELIVDGETGYLSNDNADIENKIIALLKDSEKYTRMKKNINIRNSEVNNIEKYVENIIDIYLK